MTSDPFFRSYSNRQPSRSAPFQNSQQRSSPKVVSVPVHFVSSDQPRMTLSMLKDSAALRIQRVFRGFLVRKSVKKIASIRNAVDEIERRIGDVEVGDMIRRDAKERLRVNETLMSLLFKLDSIHGVDCGVRDLRKAVTRKAIALQEKVDSMAMADDRQTLASPNNDPAKIDDGTRFLEQQVTETSGNSEAVEDGGVVNEIIPNCNDSSMATAADDRQTLDSPNNDSATVDGTSFLKLKVTETSGDSETVEDGAVGNESIANCTDSSMATADRQTLDSPKNDSSIDDGTSFLEQQVTETSSDPEANENGGVVNEITANCKAVEAAGGFDVEEDVETMRKEDHKCVAGSVEVLQKDNGKGSREVLGLLMADNEKMMKLMMQISERNEMQTRMINSLSRRVEQLEKAFMADKMRRKKKAHVACRSRGKDNFSILV